MNNFVVNASRARGLIVVALLCPIMLSACNGSSQDAGSSYYAAQAAQEASRYAEAARLEAERREARRVSIEAVLNADSHTNYTAVSDRLTAMRAIDTSQTPDDFRQAYLNHINAWDRYGRARDAMAELTSDEQLTSVVLQEAFNVVFDLGGSPVGNYTDAINRLKVLQDKASEDINSTFQAVESIAVGYGATLPPNA